ncbi:MAG TPA: pilus assembly protein PilP [Dissulfurispiraceae bacterium]|nr:pilus assembly protein PilP [Dissulfurispiraceae bacterium]
MKILREFNSIFFCAAAVMVTLFLVGCEDTSRTAGTAPKQPPQAQKQPVPVTSQESATVPSGNAARNPILEQSSQGVPYTAGLKRDPFVSLTLKADTLRKQGIGSLEVFDAGEFQLIAVVQDSSGPYAAITLPDGKSYTVRQGTKVGLYGGKVVKITLDSLIIREMVKNYKGVLTAKDTVLKLRRGDEQ